MCRVCNFNPTPMPIYFPAVLLVLVGLLTGCQEKPAAASAARAAPEVGVVVVAPQDAPLQLELPGRLSASQAAEIRPQVGGLVLKRLFTEGSRVNAGQA